MKKVKAHNSQLPFYMAKQLEPHSNAYNLCFSYTLNTNENVEQICDALQTVISLNPHLRQTFKIENNILMACLHDTLPAQIHHYKVSCDEIDNLEDLLVQEDHDIEEKSAIRLNIIKVTDSSKCILLFNIYHIIMDGTSIDAFINDLNSVIANKPVPNISIPKYTEILSKEKHLKNVQDNKLQDFYASINNMALQLDYSNSKRNGKIDYYKEIMPEKTQLLLDTFSCKHNVSAFNILLLSWSIFTALLNDKHQSLVNYPVNIRENKSLGGCFINNLIFPLDLKATDSFFIKIKELLSQTSLLKQCRKTIVPHDNIGAISSFAQSNYCKPNDLKINNESLESKSYPQIANACISIKYKNVFGQWVFSCDMYSTLFPDSIKKSLLKRYFYCLHQLLSAPNDKILKTKVTFLEEEQQIKYEFNQPLSPFDSHKTLIELFEDQVVRTPNNTAIVFDGCEKISYEKLNKKANQVAHHLTLKHQVKPNDLIALYLNRSEAIIIAILAVLMTFLCSINTPLGMPVVPLV
jgi:surfactin family lipopeptide synthetase A